MAEVFVARQPDLKDGDRRIGIYPADEFRVRCYVDFPHPLVGQQEVEMVVSPDTFRQLLARARTFCFERDIEPLRSMGLIRGGSLENAIVLTNDGVMNGPLRFPDEIVRHKVLDLMGDFALLGGMARGRPEADAPPKSPSDDAAIAETPPPDQSGTRTGESDTKTGADGASPPAPAPASPAAVAAATAERRDPGAPPASAPAPQPPGADGVARAAEPSRSSDMVALLLRHGEAMQRLGDVSAARRFYGRAAMAGSAQAATAMGEMFDPFYLGRIGARGVAPDADSAARWYRKAIELGDPNAESRLRELGREPVAAPPPSAPAATHVARAPPLPVNRKLAETVSGDCRAITLKAELGEEPSAAELSYLRQGCGRR